ncbi:MAG: hypothetical protein ACRDFX_05000, partial [Chloroflexota bacterium]
MLDPTIIGQDEQTELHVQPVIQSGLRQLDIRIWRRGPSGFAPSRSALTLDASDLEALREGITELLEASDGGHQVARVVTDKDEGRRLRAETEPFGLRYMARFGFWQRVRDTWRPVGDGLQMDADHLVALQEAIDDVQPRLQAIDPRDAEDRRISLPETALHRWPTPGADWLTTGPDRIALHPRGVRVTANVEENASEHWLEVVQWERRESLWVPEQGVLVLAVPEVEALLCRLRDVADGLQSPDDGGWVIPRDDGSAIRLTVDQAGARPRLRIEEQIDA